MTARRAGHVGAVRSHYWGNMATEARLVGLTATMTVAGGAGDGRGARAAGSRRTRRRSGDEPRSGGERRAALGGAAA
ncbi:hypothetical protein NL676_023372 [Syzygium grande]|nr:hypothetical protein NL676_023372 [Syzygium grande]